MSEKALMTAARRSAAFSAVRTPSSCRSLILLRSETARLKVAARRGGTGAKSKRSHARRPEPFESFASGRVFVAPGKRRSRPHRQPRQDAPKKRAPRDSSIDPPPRPRQLKDMRRTRPSSSVANHTEEARHPLDTARRIDCQHTSGAFVFLVIPRSLHAL